MEDKFLKLAEKLLTKNGFNIEISKIVSSEFDIDAGNYTNIYDLKEGKAMYLSFKSGDFVEKTFNIDDVNCMILAFSNSEINIKDKININGDIYTILDIDFIKAKLTTIVYKIVLGK